MIISAELGINHAGDPDVAERMIRTAKLCGADAVKVQSYRCSDFLPEGHPDWALFERCEIWPYLERLVKCAHDQGLQFGVTASSVVGAYEAHAIGADFLKNASDAILRHDIIDAMLQTGLPVWVSTGMADWEEIRDVVNHLQAWNLMLCTSLYPCPDDQANLARLAETNVFRGFSDHTQGWLAACLATALGVEMIEKHFTLDKKADGPDHWFSADPRELQLLVHQVQRTQTLLGDGKLGYMPSEAEGREKWRLGAKGELRVA